MTAYYNIEDYSFEIVEKIPVGYEIWNIGNHMQSAELVPLCQSDESYYINPNTLKAIKMTPEDATIVKKASAWYGLSSSKACVKYLKRKSGKAMKKNAAQTALKIFEKYM